jgi:rubrerythrin
MPTYDEAMIQSAAELYVHAIAMEREAAERYAEFSGRMADEGNDEVAALFGRLARLEAGHLEALRRRTEGVALPPLESDYSWIDTGAPETLAHDLVFRLMTPHQALGIALRAEKRARAFFEQARRVADDPALRALAQEMAAEEAEHIAMLEALLARTPDSVIDWASIYEPR